jgi:thiol:disulfide interchange protein DsbD
MTLPSPQALAIFASMGLGLALPYLLASGWPAVARRLPHPGPWMVMLRQLLAFPMLATVVWLLWVLGQQTNLDATSLLMAWLLGLSALVWSARFRTRSARLLQLLLALCLAWVSATWVPMLNSAANSAPSSNTLTPSSEAAPWQGWSPDKVAQSLAQNQPVFVDFTAAWCVTCQINKKTTLGSQAVLSDFQAHQVRLLRADWTRRDPAITAALSALGRSGVPVYVLYAPGRTPLVLSELLSASQIHQALAALP